MTHCHEGLMESNERPSIGEGRLHHVGVKRAELDGEKVLRREREKERDSAQWNFRNLELLKP